MFEAAVVARILASPNLAVLVGRVEWMRRSSPALPAMTLLLVSDLRGQHMTGWQPRRSRVQVDLWCATFAQAIALREAAIATLVSGGTFGGVRFQRAQVLNVRSLFEQLETGDDQKPQGELYRESIDFLLTHNGG